MGFPVKVVLRVAHTPRDGPIAAVARGPIMSPTLARRFLRAMGGLLIVLGLVHLAATPSIPFLLKGLSPEARAFALGPTLLNHMLVGVLLLPLGYTTWLASAKDHIGEVWTGRILTVNSLAVATMPVLIVSLMRDPRFYHAPLFVVGVVLATLTAISVPVAAWIASVAARTQAPSA